MAMSVQEAYSILNKLHGYTGPRTKTAISNFINARDIPIAVKNKGGMIGYQEGGDVDPDLEKVKKGQKKLVTDIATDPSEAVKKASVTDIDPETKGAEIGDTKGQAKSTVDKATATKIDDEDIEQATEPTATAPKQKVDAEGKPMVDAEGNPIYEDDITAKKSKTAVDEELKDVKAETLSKVQKKDAEGNLVFDEDGNPVYERQIQAATKDTTDVSKLDAAKIDDKDAAQIDELTEETKRKLQDNIQKRDADGNLMFDAEGNPIFEESELIKGTGVDTAKVEEVFGTGKVKAASVKDELATLMDEFDDGQTPAWAAGSMRKAMQTLAARGLGASSLAGQAVIQAAMEAALPIAQIDASNKQEMAVLKAEQRAKFMQQDFDQAFEAKVKNAARISEIADTNFTAEQQIALENAKLAQTTNIANLEAENALVLAEAAATSALELENLSNQMKAKVENARNFLQIDMANLDNEQEASLFKAQKQIDAILSDTASENAALQFNAESRQQAEQFDASLTAQVKQFNTNQKNAIKQFNAGEENAIEKFNTAQQNARDQFNADNDLVIAQANAKWRQDVETINTATENQANFDVAKEANGLTNKMIDQIWQRERDIMSFAFTQSENALDRTLRVLLGDKTLEGLRLQTDAAEGAANAELFARIFFGNKGLFGFF
tara:strand:+ start:6 stop:2006 length:2001 start_codon:yes stop_codon:yes gene_type:complete